MIAAAPPRRYRLCSSGAPASVPSVPSGRRGAPDLHRSVALYRRCTLPGAHGRASF